MQPLRRHGAALLSLLHVLQVEAGEWVTQRPWLAGREALVSWQRSSAPERAGARQLSWESSSISKRPEWPGPWSFKKRITGTEGGARRTVPGDKVGTISTCYPPDIEHDAISTDCDKTEGVPGATISKAFDNGIQCNIPFDKIRQVCESNSDTSDIDLCPTVFKEHRAYSWPTVNTTGMGPRLSDTYDAVKKSGLPNCIHARRPLPTNLNVSVWERELVHEGRDPELYSFIKFGFPLGYAGPIYK